MYKFRSGQANFIQECIELWRNRYNEYNNLRKGKLN